VGVLHRAGREQPAGYPLRLLRHSYVTEPDGAVVGFAVPWYLAVAAPPGRETGVGSFSLLLLLPGHSDPSRLPPPSQPGRRPLSREETHEDGPAMASRRRALRDMPCAIPSVARVPRSTDQQCGPGNACLAYPEGALPRRPSGRSQPPGRRSLRSRNPNPVDRGSERYTATRGLTDHLCGASRRTAGPIGRQCR
jgi:hypothetical protein